MILLTLLVAVMALSTDVEAGRTPHLGTPNQVEQPEAGLFVDGVAGPARPL